MTKGCKDCGAHGPCTERCLCAKCVDPEAYKLWKSTRPEEYRAWLRSQCISHVKECDCPSCVNVETLDNMLEALDGQV
jgi:hypothetical protein